jgi:hypothetical protein
MPNNGTVSSPINRLKVGKPIAGVTKPMSPGAFANPDNPRFSNRPRPTMGR